MRTIGIDLGGSNLRAAAFERGGDSGPEGPESDDEIRVAQHRAPVGEPRDPDAIIERVARVIEELGPDDPDEPCTVGIGLAALLRDRRGTVANSPHLRWRDVAFGERLAHRLGARFRLGIYNDVNAVTWGEVTAGAARGCRDVLAVYVGTGIGAGVVANGRLVDGATATAGELGHTKVRWDDTAAPCACGQRGCLEAYTGGGYVHDRIVRELAAAPPKGGAARSSALAYAGTLAQLTPGHVDRAAGEGDPWALALWSELAPLLGVALANAVALLNPERLVLGGGLLGRCPTLFELTVAALEIAAPRASLERLTIAAAELGDDAGVIGAARLAGAGVLLQD